LFTPLVLKKILIIGDSLCLPREKPEHVDYHQTYPYLLKQSGGVEIFQLAIGGGTIADLIDQVSYHKVVKPDIVIVQSGIVDCAPRALGRLERDIVASSRILTEIFNRFISVHKLRKFRKITFVTEKSFKNHINQLIESFDGVQLVWIGILPSSIEYENKVPGITRNVVRYNDIIRSQSESLGFKFLNTDLMVKEGIMSDHHHLTAIGHQWIFEKLSNILNLQQRQ
jgi:hypothetical protein